MSLADWTGRVRHGLALAKLAGWRALHAGDHEEWTDPASGRGVAVVGEHSPAPRWARQYLGATELGTLRCSTDRGRGAAAQRALAARHGLAVIVDWALPGALRDDVLEQDAFLEMDLDLPATGLTRETIPPDDRQRVRRQGFDYRVDRSPAFIPEFLERYHEPSVRHVHGDDGHVVSRDRLEKAFGSGTAEWVFITRGDAVEGVQVLAWSGTRARFLVLGWRDGDAELRRAGVLAATYLFSLQHVSDSGARRVELGGTAPFLDDGVLSYKAKWGARVRNDPTRGRGRFLLFDPAHAAAREFLGGRVLLARRPSGAFLALSGPPVEHLTHAVRRSVDPEAVFRFRDRPRAGGDGDARLPRPLRPWYDPVDPAAWAG